MNSNNFKITAIVLAAGLSERMGKLKQLLPFNGKTVISTVIETLLSSEVTNIFVITGNKSELVKQELKNYRVKIIYNQNYIEGMHSSIICGVKNLDINCDYFMIVLGDQPHITVNVINKLIEFANKSEKGIIIPSYYNKRGHPILIQQKYITEVNNIKPSSGLKKFINDHNDDIEYLNIAEEGILIDIDTPEDYEKLLKEFEK